MGRHQNSFPGFECISSSRIYLEWFWDSVPFHCSLALVNLHNGRISGLLSWNADGAQGEQVSECWDCLAQSAATVLYDFCRLAPTLSIPSQSLVPRDSSSKALKKAFSKKQCACYSCNMDAAAQFCQRS